MSAVLDVHFRLMAQLKDRIRTHEATYTRRGPMHNQAKVVQVNGSIYDTIEEALIGEGISRRTLRYLLDCKKARFL